MHSMGGALSESLYIYGPPIEFAASSNYPTILSMGLGLGYNELISLAYLLRAGKTEFFIQSFEKVEDLTNYFTSWSQDQPSPLDICYDQILLAISERLSVERNDLKQLLKQSLENGNLSISEALPSSNSSAHLFQAILYDAFSSKTDQGLWNEEHFASFLKNFCAPQCHFSTYAATGSLNRSLKAHGFDLQKKAGFAYKRQSTMATRA